MPSTQQLDEPVEYPRVRTLQTNQIQKGGGEMVVETRTTTFDSHCRFVSARDPDWADCSTHRPDRRGHESSAWPGHALAVSLIL